MTLKNKLSRIGSVFTILLGAVLMVYMIKFENEPGALPLLLIFAGTVWFLITGSKSKKAGIHK